MFGESHDKATLSPALFVDIEHSTGLAALYLHVPPARELVETPLQEPTQDTAENFTVRVEEGLEHRDTSKRLSIRNAGHEKRKDHRSFALSHIELNEGALAFKRI
jgi:hypothetical protein